MIVWWSSIWNFQIFSIDKFEHWIAYFVTRNSRYVYACRSHQKSILWINSNAKYQNRLSGTQVYSHAILWYTNVPYSVSSHLPCILFYLEANQIVPVQYSSYSSGNIVFNWNITIKGSREGSFNYIYNRTNFYFFQNLYYFPFVCSNWFVYFRFSGNYLRWGVVDICFSKLLSLGCRKLRRNNESNGTTPFNF